MHPISEQNLKKTKEVIVMTGFAKSFNLIRITTRRVIQMTFFKKSSGLLRSVRSWGVLGLFLALATASCVYEQAQAVPPANNVKLKVASNVLSKTICVLVARVAFVGQSGSPNYPLAGNLVTFYKNGPPYNLITTVAKKPSVKNGEAPLIVLRPPTGTDTYKASIVGPNGQLIFSNPVACGASSSDPH